jgi:hypothetical protein
LFPPDDRYRHANESVFAKVDMAEAFESKGLYQNLVFQNEIISTFLHLTDLDADGEAMLDLTSPLRLSAPQVATILPTIPALSDAGDLDLVIQSTWVTFYFENQGNRTHADFVYRVDRPVVVTSNLNYYSRPLMYDIDGDGELRKKPPTLRRFMGSS